jgi:hypothetical protein
MSQFYRQVLDRNVPGITPEAPLDDNAAVAEQAGANQ